LEVAAEDVLLGLLPFAATLVALAIGIVLVMAVLIVRPEWLDWMQASLTGAEPKVYWYLSRASAVVSYAMVWASMVLGLAITNKLARLWPGGPTFVALHEHTSWLGLVFALFHALVLMGDAYIGYTLDQVLIPFASAAYRPLWVGLGQLALYLLALVVLSFYARRWIGQRLWRSLHYLSFVVFALGLVHGLLSGTDSANAWVSGMYWASAASVVGLSVFRVWRARSHIQTIRTKP
jgi:predicted ferric reductase